MKVHRYLVKTHGANSSGDLALDVVCGMELATKAARFSAQHKKTTYYFCSSNCLQHFKNAPERYIGR